jgi:hypothetical protein
MHGVEGIQGFRSEGGRAAWRKKIGCDENRAPVLLRSQQEIRQLSLGSPAGVNQNVGTAIQKLPRDFKTDTAACARHDNIAILKKLGMKHALDPPGFGSQSPIAQFSL